MKIDRLLGITTYLLNQERVSATTLSKRFEVSVRTIQRDIDSLCIAGIPIVAYYGNNGGYEIQEGYKLKQQLIKDEDYSFIITALQGLTSAYGNPQIKNTIDKFSMLSTNMKKNYIKLDLSLLKDHDLRNQQITTIDSAIANKKTITYTYTNNQNITSKHTVEPLCIMFKWHDWYLIGYSIPKESYRLYKLARMEDIRETEQSIEREHENIDTIIERMSNIEHRTFWNITILCERSIKHKVLEYLDGDIVEIYEDGSFLFTFKGAINDFAWFSTLLSFKEMVTVKKPQELIHRMITMSQDILNKYQT